MVENISRTLTRSNSPESALQVCLLTSLSWTMLQTGHCYHWSSFLLPKSALACSSCRLPMWLGPTVFGAVMVSTWHGTCDCILTWGHPDPGYCCWPSELVIVVQHMAQHTGMDAYLVKGIECRAKCVMESRQGKAQYIALGRGVILTSPYMWKTGPYI
jgi:hypothetical protein